MSLSKTECQQVELSDIAEYGNAPSRNDFRSRTMFQTSSARGVQQLVPEMARLVQVYGEPFLNGDAKAYEVAHEARAALWNQFETEMKLRDIRRRLDTAWQGRNYSEVVSLCEPVRELLTSAELKKLDYAKRKSQASE